MARKTNTDERLDDASIERAIKCLEDKGTKKTACQILNIAYNTTRLDKLIEAYKTKKVDEARRRQEKRGKPATADEISWIITEYLAGSTLTAISNSTYRGPTFIRSILEEYNVPTHAVSPDYFKPELIPDGATRDRFSIGEIVYSARYASIAKVITEILQGGIYVYRLWLMDEKWKEYAYQPAYEIASLQTLRDKGINI